MEPDGRAEANGSSPPAGLGMGGASSAAQRPWAERGASLAERGQLAEAADAYTQAAAEHPDDGLLLLALGATLVQLGRYDAAERELRRALKLAPDDAEVHLQLGLTLYKRGNYTAAAAELRRAAEANPSATAFLVLGEALNQMLDPDAAIQALEEAVRLQPDNGKAYYAMGIAYDRKRQFDRAAEMYRLSRGAGARPAASA